MTHRTAIFMTWLQIGLVAALLGWSGQAAWARAEDYAQVDVKITGGTIQAFDDGDEQPLMVLDDFKMTVGERVLTGRDAVIWISSRKVGTVELKDIHVYVEGDAELAESGAASTGDRLMFVVFQVRGRVSAESAEKSDKPLAELPLYRRAQAARRELNAPSAGDGNETAAKKARDPHPAPDLFRLEELPKPRSEQPETAADAPKADEDADDDEVAIPIEVVDNRTGKRARPDRTPAKVTEPSEPTEPTPLTRQTDTTTTRTDAPDSASAEGDTGPVPVNMYVPKLISEKMGPGGRRVTVFSGGVYLSQGDPDSENFLELRADNGVVFSEVLGADGKPIPTKDTYSPMSPRIGGGRETVVGVYLEGDVVMSRGERFMRGPEAYYDFTADRAIMIDPVFRTVQEQRNIPVYIRAEEGRMLSARETWFRDAKVSSSEFHSPTYHFGAGRVYMMDKTAYDETGQRVSQRRLEAKMTHSTINVRSVPVFYMPWLSADAEQGHTPLRKATVGFDGQYGFTGETEWHLFRLLGLTKPEGVSGRVHLNYRRGPEIGVALDYERENYSGFVDMWGLIDQEQEDEFGQENKDIDAPKNRGRILARHKQFLARDWQMQAELAYLCDRNYLRQFFPDEFYGGKEQETLLYAKKQRDNWALDVLLQTRINRFLTQTESAPDVGFRLLGEPLLGDQLTTFGEAKLGFKRLREGTLESRDKRILARTGQPIPDDSDWLGRFAGRAELDYPMSLGPVRVVPYVANRLDYWSRRPTGGEKNRLYGEVGVRATAHLWRVYNNISSRLWDLDKLRHIIMPEVGAFLACNNATPDDLFALTPEVEEHIEELSGVTFGVRQRLQTKRGPAGNRRTVDWMRLDIMAGFFSGTDRFHPSADGRYFMSRPEYSLGRDFVNIDYAWHISDSTTFLAEVNIDTEECRIGRSGIGLAVQRSPRLQYYVGLRTIDDLDSAIATLAFTYQLSRKYTVNFVQQYDFDYRGGDNLVTSLTLVRKFPRWYMGVTGTYDARWDDYTIMLNLWPEGVPEVGIRTGQMSLLNRSEKN
ncbi:MAG: LPS-assembly protein LptD [Planctomycetota bacterium]|jgi:hypothetical protein